MTNIICKSRKEIDLLAIDPKTLDKYHIEACISISKNFALKEEDLPYYQEKKFEHPIVREKVISLFGDSKYRKVFVVWNTKDNFTELPRIAEQNYGFEIWGLRGMILKFIQEKITIGSRDEVLRTMELVGSMRQEERAFLKKLDK
jgi:hypothetical protein